MPFFDLNSFSVNSTIAFVGFFGVFIFLIGLWFFIYFKTSKKKFLKSLDLKLLLISLPLKQKSEGDFKEELNLSVQLFNILSGLDSYFAFEVGVHHLGEEIHFYLAVEKKFVESVRRQIEGLFKGAHIEEVSDYNIFNPAGVSKGAYLLQRYSFVLPIKTFKEANIDTFLPILSGLTKINEVGEGVAIQVIGRGSDRKKAVIKAIEKLKKGENPEEILKGASILKEVSKVILPEKEKKESQEKIVDESLIKALEEKISSNLLEVNVRIIVSAPNNLSAETILESILSSYQQFFAPKRQELKVVKPRNLKKFFYQYSFRLFDESQKMILNAEELASLMHLPTSFTHLPKIKWLKSKQAPAPENLPKQGTLIGESVFRGEKKPIYITDEDRRRHIYIIGQTGTGKSNLLTFMIQNDIERGKGVAVIDPHGDLVEEIAGSIPKERIDEVIFFDPSDLLRPIGINMLEYDFSRPEQKTFIVDELFKIFDQLYNLKETGGPIFEQYTKNAILLLAEDMKNEPATLMEIPRVFTDRLFRERKLQRISNPTVVDFWTKEAPNVSGEHSIENMAPYFTSKFNQFIANDYLRPIIAQEKSAFNFRQIMDEGKILLVKLAKGRIGDLNANLLGMIFVGRLLMAALSRVDIDQSQRRDFNLFIDEFQNFTTDSISIILSEARKYRLNLVIAHQFIAQLKENIRDAVFGNVGNLISFRVGADDAEFLKKQFEPIFDENDLINIDNFCAYVKILIGGQPTLPFNIKTFPAKKGDFQLAKEVKELSRFKYGKDRDLIEAEIIKRLRE